MDILCLLLMGVGAGILLMMSLKKSIVNGDCAGCSQSGNENCSCKLDSK